MDGTVFVVVLLGLSAVAYYFGRRRSLSLAVGAKHHPRLHSLPSYYGWYTALWCGVPALVLFALWAIFEPAIIVHLVVAGLPRKLREELGE